MSSEWVPGPVSNLFQLDLRESPPAVPVPSYAPLPLNTLLRKRELTDSSQFTVLILFLLYWYANGSSIVFLALMNHYHCVKFLLLWKREIVAYCRVSLLISCFYWNTSLVANDIDGSSNKQKASWNKNLKLISDNWNLTGLVPYDKCSPLVPPVSSKVVFLLYVIGHWVTTWERLKHLRVFQTPPQWKSSSVAFLHKMSSDSRQLSSNYSV